MIKYFGDKIAIIRVNVAKLFALLLFHFNVSFLSFKNEINDNFYGDNKTWIEKQTVLIMIKEYLILKKENYEPENDSKKFNISDITDKEFHKFILQILKDSLNGFKSKDQ